ncbi:MAG: hypothetical protein Kow0069_28400 [Promethearchaeota archaeon]
MFENEKGVAIPVARAAGASLALGLLAWLNFGGVKTPQNFRVTGDLVQNAAVLAFVLLLLLPDGGTLRRAARLGLVVMAYDFFLETTAAYAGWWFPLGGTQWPPLLVVPLEMVLSFGLVGASTGVLFAAPELVRREAEKPPARRTWPHRWLLRPFRNPRTDPAWILAYVALVSLVGTRGDYSAGPEVWVPGEGWHPALTFLAWLSGGLVAYAAHAWLKRRGGAASPTHVLNARSPASPNPGTM